MAYTYRKDILEKIEALVNGMLEAHNKVFPVRMDFHFPRAYRQDGRNSEIQCLLKLITQHYRRQGIDLRYLAVREHGAGPNPHYHAAFLVDGNHRQNPSEVQGVATMLWQSIVRSGLTGIVHYCVHEEGHRIPALEMIRRPSSVATRDRLVQQIRAFERSRKILLDHMAYLAKDETKCRGDDSSADRRKIPDGVREVLASQAVRRTDIRKKHGLDCR